MTLPVVRRRCDFCHEHEQPVDPASRKRTFEVVHIGQWWCRHPEGRETREIRDDGAIVSRFPSGRSAT